MVPSILAIQRPRPLPKANLVPSGDVTGVKNWATRSVSVICPDCLLVIRNRLPAFGSCILAGFWIPSKMTLLCASFQPLGNLTGGEQSPLFCDAYWVSTWVSADFACGFPHPDRTIPAKIGMTMRNLDTSCLLLLVSI